MACEILLASDWCRRLFVVRANTSGAKANDADSESASMAQSVSVPTGWEVIVDRREHHQVVDREYTTLVYEHPSSKQRVIVNDVQEPNKFGGWGYLVHAQGGETGELDLVEDIETARDVALEFMKRYDG